MTKIEPMTDTQIKTLLQPPHLLALQTKQLILRWIHAEARARMLEYIGRHYDCEDVCFFDEEHIAFDEGGELPYFIAAVKAEVGWVEDKC